MHIDVIIIDIFLNLRHLIEIGLRDLINGLGTIAVDQVILVVFIVVAHHHILVGLEEVTSQDPLYEIFLRELLSWDTSELFVVEQ